jgi:RHS repeat-associated protein
MGHVIKYGYEAGNLVSVTEPGESSPRWTFKYNGAREMTEMANGVGGKTTNEYNEAHQVVSQTSPLGQKLAFKYESVPGEHSKGDMEFAPIYEETSEEEEDPEPIEASEVTEGFYSSPPEQETTITNESTGAVEHEHFNSEDELATVTRAAGTANETTETLSYNSGGELSKRTDGDKHTTEYGYDAGGDLTSEKNPDGDETKRECNSTHDLTAVTEPNGEKTTIERDSHGNATAVSRPAPKEETQTTKYKYKSDGELEAMTDPLGHEWKYEYDSYGDRTAETDPEGNKRTWEYNEDSQQTATVSPRGNATGAEPAKFKTTTERNAQSLPVKITDPLGHTTEYKYNADGDVEAVTDANKHATSYSYNGEDEPIKTKEPNGDTTETEYDKAGQVIAQIDGNKHKTKYKRNVLEQVTEVTDPLGHLTTKEYDAAGNLVKLTDPAKRTTSYTYDPANRLIEVTYSDGKTPPVKYEYNKDGDRTKMTDGTGTTTFTLDQLDRLSETENGHKETVKYEYNLANDQTKITYPNGKAVTRAFDKDDRLEKVTDWSSNVTKFTYNPDSQLATIVFPTATKDEDSYAYNDADQMTEVKMGKGSETLASLVYTRDNDGQVKKTTSKKLPGTETTEATYDEDNRVTKYGSTEYKYDAANNPTKLGATAQTFNEGDELEKAATSSYSFDELGERTKQTPEKGPATTYGYNQASELTSAERPKEGSTPEIKDTYAYNGEDLRTSQTISGTTNYLAWDMAEELPLILNDGTNSYIYGAAGPSEQINNSTGAVTYLHHDQAGSTRLLTGSTGTVTGKCTYNAYGTPTCEGTASTPLGYDAQYTNTDTGLIYLRARTYDPATAQFLNVDPAVSTTRAPYNYSRGNPLNQRDPSGRVTVGICVSGEIALGIRIGGGVCGQVSSSGEVGATATINGGVATGAGASAGIGLQGSTGEHVAELGGPFLHLGGSIHAGGGVSADTFFGGADECGNRVTGGEISLGVGAGADQYGGVSETEAIATGL